MALDRFVEVARRITGVPAARAADGLAWVRTLYQQLEVKPLAAHGIAVGDFADIVAKASRASSMRGNPIVLTEEELLEILHNAL